MPVEAAPPVQKKSSAAVFREFSKHFEDSAFTTRTLSSRKEGLKYQPELRPDAVPTLFGHSETQRKRKQDLTDRRFGRLTKRRRQQELAEILSEDPPIIGDDTRVGKIIDAASKLKRNATLSLWSKSITKHMYWCSSSSPEGPNRAQLVKDKWVSISNHVADIHEGHGGLFPKCQHDQLVPRAWIKKGEENQ
ncbi:hypothetical protein BaRGS_00021694 [Batillaria attramentaria]|uniref:Uncharacterized protein n=1 Tax=Batillaria attramentaria TaxID=370345 RepID=A0ABD0KIM3_9CAEN